MYPAKSQVRPENFLHDIPVWNANQAPRVAARERAAGKSAVSRLGEFHQSYSRIIATGISAALLVALNLILFLAGNDALVRSFEGPVLWLQSPLIWIALIVAQLCFLVAFLAEDRSRRRVEIFYRQSQDDLTLAAASANIGLWNWDLDNDRINASQLCRQILGMRPDARCSLRQFFEIVNSDDREPLRQAIDGALASGHKFNIEVRVVLRERGLRWIGASGQARYDNEQRPIGLTGVFMDITDRKRAEMEAAQQREYITHLTRVRMIGDLSGAVAHELNQPLAAILSNAQAAHRMLSRQSVDLGEVKTALKDIIDDDSRAAQVIKHLRSLLMKSDPKLESTDLVELVTEALDLVRAELIERQIRLVVRLEAALPMVKADKVQLQQVVLNLILNAADALMENPSANRILTVSVSSMGQSLELLCSDNGPGIPPEIMTKVFEPFYTTKKHGLGLGLMISRAIVTTHSGSLWVTNNPDRGATFHLSLPALTMAMS